MKTFDILDRNLDIHKNLLLEASAGTGKTFSIENIYVRLLIEEPALTVDQILVVTFTRAATSELRERIHQCIEMSLYLIKNGSLEGVPDYLKNAGNIEKRRLEHALSDFDQACITTIHAFCEKTLKESAYLFDEETESMNELIKRHEVRKVIHDFFLTGLTKGKYSPQQLQRVLSYHHQDLKRLENALHSLVTKGLEIGSTEPYEALFRKFQIFIAEHDHDSKKLLEDFSVYAPSFKNICNREKETKPEIMQSIQNFCECFHGPVTEKHFETLISEGLLYATLLDDSNLKSKAALPEAQQLHYPHFVKSLREGLLSVVEQARNPHLILARMAHDCQKMLQKFLHREEKYQYDDLLKKMLKRASGAHFSERLREIYQAVIIDEFQDTDPVQWGIFKEIFLKDPKERAHLYLVGDPKQSIYAFRQADIYTYLSAAESLGSDHVMSLKTNYRSEPDLVEGLNTLFSPEVIPQFFHLPKLQRSLLCEKVQAGRSSLKRLDDERIKSIHFIFAKGKKKAGKWPTRTFQADFFFSTIVKEMIRLKQEKEISFSSWAILVRDRYQADDFARFCELNGIPARKQKQKSLISSPAYQGLKDILHALNHPHDLSALKLVLGGCVVGFTPEQLLELDSSDRLVDVCNKWSKLSELVLSMGFSEFVFHFFNTRWNGKQTLYETCITHSEELYDEFCQICELVSVYQHEQNASILRCEQYLEDLERTDDQEEESLKCRQNLDHEACEILTIHTSKGLEYDIVVPIGLINRTPKKDYFIPVQNDAEGHLLPIVDESSDLFRQFQKEVDAEKMRQLYVALTRAKHRLYLPIAFEESGLTGNSEGEFSPWELFLHNFQPCQGDREKLKAWLASHQTIFSYETIETCGSVTPFVSQLACEKLVTPKKVSFITENQRIQSFSSLSKMHTPPEFMEAPPHDFSSAVKNPFTIPSGREIGLLLHSILESISYKQVKECPSPLEMEGMIRPFVQHTIFVDWLKTITEMIFTVLKKPLQTKQGFLSLCDVEEESRYHEIEFLYPHPEGLLKGVIDLVFEWEGLYYLVDWKSNWLGKTGGDYCFESLGKAMKIHEYDLQESIYREALQRYLKAFEERPFKECFGGSYYLFLRGINGENDHGVYTVWE